MGIYDALVKYFNPIRNTYFTNKTASDKTINQIPATVSAICIETVNIGTENLLSYLVFQKTVYCLPWPVQYTPEKQITYIK